MFERLLPHGAALAIGLLGLLSVNASAAPTAATATFNDNIAEPGSIVFNIHEAGLVGGFPMPIYVLDNFDTSGAPASVTATRVGNACIRVEWGDDNSVANPFSISYTLIGGDTTTSNRGTFTFQNGARDLFPVLDTANGCDDIENQPPQTQPLSLSFPSVQPALVFPIISSDGPATDIDGVATVRFTDTSCFVQPQNGTISVDPQSPRNLVFQPNTGWNGGSDSFEYCVTDNPFGAATGVRGTVTFTVGASQTIDAIDDTATATVFEPVVIDVLANDTVNSDTVLSIVTRGQEGGFTSILPQSECAQTFPGIETQCIIYTPPSTDAQGNTFVGDDTFSYTISLGADTTDTATVTVTVVPADPVVSDDTATTPSQTPVVIDVRANDAVASGEVIEAVSTPSNGGTAELLSAAACEAALGIFDRECIRYTPPTTATGEPPFSGTDTFNYLVVNGPASSTASVTVTVDAPTDSMRNVVADTATTTTETEIVIDVLGNDQLLAGDQLIGVSPGSNGGTVEILDVAACTAVDDDFFQQCVRYTPPATTADGVVFTGDDTFTYNVGNSDEFVTGSVTVSVVAPNGTPQPVADDQTQVEEGGSVEIDVLANDIDDGGAQNLTIVSVTDPANGTATINRSDASADTVTYTPNAGFTGTDSFFYTVSDGDPQTPDQAAQVTVNVARASGRRTLSSLALTPEERELASAIDTVCDRLNDFEDTPELEGVGRAAVASPSELRTRCNALIDFANPVEGDNTAAVRDALRQISGEEVFAQSTISTQILNTQSQNIDARLEALRGGARGISAQGLALNIQGKTLPSGLLARRAVEDEENALLEDSRLGFFINGRLNFGEQDPTATENGFDFDTLGVTAGVDYRFRNDLAIGAAIGFANSEADYNNSGGRLDSDSLTYSLYGTYFTDRLYVDMLAVFGGIDFDSERTMVFADSAGGVDTTALGSTEGDQRQFSANFGYNINRDGWLFVPFVGYDYLDTSIDAFSETQGQGWELAFDEQKVQSQIVSAGLRMSYTHSMSVGVLVPHLRLATQHELEDDLRVLTARFVNDPGATRFRFFTDAPDSSFFQWAAGLSLVMENGVAAYVDYESLTGYNNLESSTLTLGLRFERRFK